MVPENETPTQAVPALDGDVSETAVSDPRGERSSALDAEWLEADGLGGFASGTVGGMRTRRQHALLQVATSPTHRCVLVNGFDAWAETPSGTYALTSQRYHPDVVHPDGVQRLASFSRQPWPRWSYALEDGTRIEQEIFARHGSPLVAVGWRLLRPAPEIHLLVRPFFSCRDAQTLHRENPDFDFEPQVRGRFLHWKPYPGVPDIFLLSNSEYTHAPVWYRNFVYTADAPEANPADVEAVEDLASPGTLAWDLSSIEAVFVLASEEAAFEGHLRARASFRALRAVELARRRHLSGDFHAPDTAT
jgi:predicted glycogen debranching enzyme